MSGLALPGGVMPSQQQIPVLPIKMDCLRAAAETAAPGEDMGLTLRRAEEFFNWALLHPSEHTVKPKEGVFG